MCDYMKVNEVIKNIEEEVFIDVNYIHKIFNYCARTDGLNATSIQINCSKVFFDIDRLGEILPQLISLIEYGFKDSYVKNILEFKVFNNGECYFSMIDIDKFLCLLVAGKILMPINLNDYSGTLIDNLRWVDFSKNYYLEDKSNDKTLGVMEL